MRNWNILTEQTGQIPFFCFEPTYEELKPLSPIRAFLFACMFWAYLWGIETRPQQVYSYKTDDSFEPTYEELKLLIRRQEWICINRFEPTYEELKPSSGEDGKGKLCMFWAYLWGIETRNTRDWNISRSRSFEPTYEELKLTSADMYFWDILSFWAYLWGIET